MASSDVDPIRPVRVRDDRGREHRFLGPPTRIVSLVPSDTYSIIRLGGRARLVGRTRYCVEPAAEVLGIETVGGTKDAALDRIVALAPDLVVANREENTQSDVEALEAAGLRVLVAFPKRVEAGIAHLARLGVLLGVSREASPGRDLVAAAYQAVRAAQARKGIEPKVRVFVPIWMDPLMTANGDTFLSDMLDLVGAENVFADRERRYPLAADIGDAKPLSPERLGERDTRYPRVTLAEVAARSPDLVLLPDEPHAFSEADADVFRKLDMPAAKRSQVHLSDGKDLLWHGARSVEGIARLRALVDGAREALLSPPEIG